MTPFVPASESVWQAAQLSTKSFLPAAGSPSPASRCATAPHPAARSAVTSTSMRIAGRTGRAILTTGRDLCCSSGRRRRSRLREHLQLLLRDRGERVVRGQDEERLVGLLRDVVPPQAL